MPSPRPRSSTSTRDLFNPTRLASLADPILARRGITVSVAPLSRALSTRS
jgi:hypothetical protein